MGDKTLGSIIRGMNLQEEAQIRRSSDLRPKISMKLTIDLGVLRTAANPLVVSQPFNGFLVQSATDANTAAQMSLGGLDTYNTDNSFDLGTNASAYSETEIKQAVITNAQQVGKTITIIFFVGVDFRPGSFLSELTGAISVISGSTFTTGNMGAGGADPSIVVTVAATQLLASNGNRSCFTGYTDAAIWIGDFNVAVGRGVFVAGGTSFKISNTGPVYAITPAGVANVTGVEEQV